MYRFGPIAGHYRDSVENDALNEKKRILRSGQSEVR